MGLKHFSLGQVVEHNKPERQFLTHAAQLCHATAVAAGPQHGFKRTLPARPGAGLILKFYLAGFLSPWPCQNCLPGRGSMGEPTLVTCPCFRRPQLSSGRLGAAETAETAELLRSLCNPAMDALGLRRGSSAQRRTALNPKADEGNSTCQSTLESRLERQVLARQSCPSGSSA